MKKNDVNFLQMLWTNTNSIYEQVIFVNTENELKAVVDELTWILGRNNNERKK